MKKRYLFPALGLLALVVLSRKPDESINIAACNNGNLERCERIRHYANKKLITNQEFLAKAEQKEAEASKWKPTKNNVSTLAYACAENKLKPMLKDPSSLKVLNRGMSEVTDTHVTVFVDYNARNGFGGVTRDVHQCTYTR